MQQRDKRWCGPRQGRAVRVSADKLRLLSQCRCSAVPGEPLALCWHLPQVPPRQRQSTPARSCSRAPQPCRPRPRWAGRSQGRRSTPLATGRRWRPRRWAHAARRSWLNAGQHQQQGHCPVRCWCSCWHGWPDALPVLQQAHAPPALPGPQQERAATPLALTRGAGRQPHPQSRPSRGAAAQAAGLGQPAGAPAGRPTPLTGRGRPGAPGSTSAQPHPPAWHPPPAQRGGGGGGEGGVGGGGRGGARLSRCSAGQWWWWGALSLGINGALKHARRPRDSP